MYTPEIMLNVAKIAVISYSRGMLELTPRAMLVNVARVLLCHVLEPILICIQLAHLIIKLLASNGS